MLVDQQPVAVFQRCGCVDAVDPGGVGMADNGDLSGRVGQLGEKSDVRHGITGGKRRQARLKFSAAVENEGTAGLPM